MSRAKVIEMRNERAGIWEQAKVLNEKALEEKRDFTAEETTQYDKMMNDMDSLKARIDRTENQLAQEDEMNKLEEPHKTDPQPGQASANPRASAEYQEAYNRFLVNGINSLSKAEIMNMAADPDSEGGYLTVPEQMAAGILKAVDDMVFIRQFATKHTLTLAKSLGVVSLETDFDDAEWVTELKTGSVDDLALGKRELRPHPLAKRVKISNTLLRLTAGGAEALVRERLAYRYGITQEKAYMTGNGNLKPLGLFTASTDGISTTRDEAGTNTATAIVADTLIDALYKLKGQYQARARWGFHRDAVKMIRKLKNAVDGTYLWQPGLQGGQPDTILSKPFFQSEYIPNTFTTGQYVGIVGDFSFYWIVDALNMSVQRLVELYAETNQTGFIGRYEGDGQPVLEEAFTRIKLG